MNTAISADGSAITFDRVGTEPTLILVGGAFRFTVAHTLPYDGALMAVGGTLPPHGARITTSTLIADCGNGEAWMTRPPTPSPASCRTQGGQRFQAKGHGVAAEAIAPVLREFFLA